MDSSYDETDDKMNEDNDDKRTVISSCVPISTQYNWKLEQPDKSFDLLPGNRSEEELNALNSDTLLVSEKNGTETSLVIRNWPLHSDSSTSQDQKFLPADLSQQYVYNNPSSLEEENYLLKLDYKSRNKLKTKERRMDPFYRSQERIKQRAVMRKKREDPVFRATEREKGRYRMRLKRLDPEFRTQERERQRERMKAKRSNPEYREKEREQQKNRLHIKRMDPAFKEKERAHDKIRMFMKSQNSSFFTNLQTDTIKMCSGNENVKVVSEKVLKDIYEPGALSREFQNRQSVFPDIFCTKQLSALKSRESLIDSFNFRKQHILNYNYNSPNREQWSQEICPKTLLQLSDDEESDCIMTDTGEELLKKIPESDNDDKAKESSPVTIKSSEMILKKEQKQECSSNQFDSPNKFVLLPDPEQ